MLNVTELPALPVTLDTYGVTLALTNAAGESLDEVVFSAAECALGPQGRRDRLSCASSTGRLVFTQPVPGAQQKKYGANGRWTVTAKLSGRNTTQAATTTPLGLAMWTSATPVISFTGASR